MAIRVTPATRKRLTVIADIAGCTPGQAVDRIVSKIMDIQIANEP